MPDIFTYTDYRKFLSDAWAERKALDPKFSHRFIGLRAGFASSGFFSRILSGDVNLTPTGTLKLAEIFRLARQESRYFELLVLFNQARSAEEKALFLDRIVVWRRSSIPSLDPSQIDICNDWRVVTILQTLDIIEHVDRHDELGAMLRPPVEGSEVERILHLLEKNNLVHREENGVWRKLEAVLSSGLGSGNAVKAFRRSMMELGIEAVDCSPVEEQSLSTLTLSLSSATFERLRDRLRHLRKEALELALADESPDRVVQVTLHAFPLAVRLQGTTP